MIVKDPILTRQTACDIGNKVISLIKEETKNFPDEGDPAEQIYLACHISAFVNARIAILLENFCKIYAIPNTSQDMIIRCIEGITPEYLRLLNGNKKDE